MSKSENEQCDFETGHDREAYLIVRNGLEVQTQERLAILARGGSRSKAHTISDSVRNLKANVKRPLLS